MISYMTHYDPCLVALQVSDVSLFHTVYLTGGTDGTENFGDLWLLKGCHVAVRRVEVRDQAASPIL